MFLSTLLSTKLAVAVAATSLVTVGGGAAAAAYSGVLPSSLQTAAHDTIGAPAPKTDSGDSSASTDTTSTDKTASTTDTPPTTTASPVGPDATGPAAFGLCTAYLHGGLAATSVAYQSLLTAALAGTTVDPTATDQANITAYCTTITHPGQAATHPTGKPATGPSVTHPTGKPATGPSVTHPTGKPATVPVGPPSTH